jgi:hypothetical protein
MIKIVLLGGRVELTDGDKRIALKEEDSWLVAALALAHPDDGLPARTIQDILGVDIRSGALRQRIRRLQERTRLIIEGDLRSSDTYHLAMSEVDVDALRYLELVKEVRRGTSSDPEALVEEARSLWTAGPPRFQRLASPAPECYDRLAEAHDYLQYNGRRILIVDDQVGDRLKTYLPQHQCEVAHDLKEFETFRDTLDNFDLAVVDLHLTKTYADSTGDVIVRDINSRGSNLPVVMITLRPPENRSVPEWIKSLGLVDVIFKAGDEPEADMAYVARRVEELLREDPAARACEQLVLKVHTLRRKARQRLRNDRSDADYETAVERMDREADVITRLAGAAQLSTARVKIERFIVHYGV